MLLGLIVIAGPWVLSGATTASTVNDMIVGAIVIAFTRGPKTERYGSWDRWVR